MSHFEKSCISCPNCGKGGGEEIWTNPKDEQLFFVNPSLSKNSKYSNSIQGLAFGSVILGLVVLVDQQG